VISSFGVLSGIERRASIGHPGGSHLFCGARDYFEEFLEIEPGCIHARQAIERIRRLMN